MTTPGFNDGEKWFAHLIVESKTSWKQDQWDNEVSSLEKKKESITKMQGGAILILVEFEYNMDV